MAEPPRDALRSLGPVPEHVSFHQQQAELRAQRRRQQALQSHLPQITEQASIYGHPSSSILPHPVPLSLPSLDVSPVSQKPVGHTIFTPLPSVSIIPPSIHPIQPRRLFPDATPAPLLQAPIPSHAHFWKAPHPHIISTVRTQKRKPDKSLHHPGTQIFCGEKEFEIQDSPPSSFSRGSKIKANIC